MNSLSDFSSHDLKHYPHFDAPISLPEIERLVTDLRRVAANAFYPFLLYHEQWQPYRSGDAGRPKKKVRPIRYGARRDAYIFMHYRRKLAKLYEDRLRDLGIAHCPIAYRQIPRSTGSGGKCNIDFAKDAFDEVDRLGACVVIALDIKSYFESLDHSLIKQIWCDLLEADELPPDHYAVFKNITKYRYVDQMEIFRRLGFLGSVERGAKMVEGFKVAYRNIPKQLCSPADFRAKICGGDPAYPSLIQKNTKAFGIPQGAPISDLIANFYLMEFDCVMNKSAAKHGGRYVRYSDDILVIVPGGESEAESTARFAVEEIRKHGSQLQINKSKTCVIQFRRRDKHLLFRHVKQHSGQRGANGLEYLGFRYDGRRVYVRDKTISRFYRKVARAAKHEGFRYVNENPGLNREQLIRTFNYSLFSQRFGRVRRTELTSDYRSWTFYSYLKRAAAAFCSRENRILAQAREFKAFMRTRVTQAINQAVDRKSRTGTIVRAHDPANSDNRSEICLRSDPGN